MSDEKKMATTNYYVLLADLKSLIPEDVRDLGALELDEIEQISKAVNQISGDPPQFYTTT